MSNTNEATYVVLKNVRLSYAKIWKPEAMEEGQEPKFSTSLIISKDDKANLTKIKDAVAAAKKQLVDKLGGKEPKGLKLPLRDGDEDREDTPGYAGAYFINASSKRKPEIVDGKREPITEESRVYSGCFVNVSINFYPFDTKGNKGVAAGLGNIQLVKQGEPLGGTAKRAKDEFEEIEDADDEDWMK
jgi:hypothetical protein